MIHYDTLFTSIYLSVCLQVIAFFREEHSQLATNTLEFVAQKLKDSVIFAYVVDNKYGLDVLSP